MPPPQLKIRRNRATALCRVAGERSSASVGMFRQCGVLHDVSHCRMSAGIATIARASVCAARSLPPSARLFSWYRRLILPSAVEGSNGFSFEEKCGPRPGCFLQSGPSWRRRLVTWRLWLASLPLHHRKSVRHHGAIPGCVQLHSDQRPTAQIRGLAWASRTTVIGVRRWLPDGPCAEGILSHQALDHLEKSNAIGRRRQCAGGFSGPKRHPLAEPKPNAPELRYCQRALDQGPERFMDSEQDRH
jgi:hypothetical protein